ncbi:MAG: CDGSH iron-sulfur domain-containing protein [Methanomassiliicoccus sp.]|nr:CDGSH iron-sulfur domain-containing protein [Methanomassiliicoccus sp.]
MVASKNAKIQVCKDGPYLVSGRIPLVREEIVRGPDGNPREWKKVADLTDQENYALCRCGRSNDPPYCDGSHLAGFDGTETAVRRTRAEEPKLVKGPGVDLDPNAAPCARAQFCHRGGGIGKLVSESGEEDKRGLAVEVAGQCPAGRLVVYDKATGKPIEPVFEREISVTEDPMRGVSGPLWVKGGVIIEGADGEPYIVRNRVALCRCGQSKRMPLCDGTHIDIKFDRMGDRK